MPFNLIDLNLGRHSKRMDCQKCGETKTLLKRYINHTILVCGKCFQKWRKVEREKQRAIANGEKK